MFLQTVGQHDYVFHCLGAEDNSADDSSIVLSFGDTNDERIEEAVL
jgi:hypothetical protein